MNSLRLATKQRFLQRLSSVGGHWVQGNPSLSLNTYGRRWASSAPQMSEDVEVLCFLYHSFTIEFIIFLI